MEKSENSIIIEFIVKKCDRRNCDGITTKNKPCKLQGCYKTNILEKESLCGTHAKEYKNNMENQETNEVVEKLEDNIEKQEIIYKNEVKCEKICKGTRQKCEHDAVLKARGRYFCTQHFKASKIPENEKELLIERPIISMLSPEEIQEIIKMNDKEQDKNKKMNNRCLKHYLTILNIAKNKNFTLLSTFYLGDKENIECRCNFCGEIWTPTPSDIKQGSGCPLCSGRKKLIIEDMYKLGQKKGYKFESDRYNGVDEKYWWKCEIHGNFKATPSHIRENKGCPDCGGTLKYTLEEVREFVELKGGWCYSEIYYDTHTDMEFWCGNLNHGHWFTCFASIKNSESWCPDCAGNRKYTLEEVKEFAISKGGECFSEFYDNNKTKMEFWCGNLKHEHWFATFNSIKNNETWCPHCNQSKGERAVAEFLNKYNYKYKSEKEFTFLLRKLYDFFLYELDIVIEYDGIIHFIDVEFFNQKTTFEEKREIDILKTKTVLENGYKIIRIDYNNINNIEYILTEALKSEEQLIFSQAGKYDWIIENCKVYKYKTIF